MKKQFKFLAIITMLSLAVTGVSFAGANIKPKVEKVNGSGQIRTGVTNIKSINFYSTAAGDKLAVYDVNSVNGVQDSELMFEIGITANYSSQPGPYMGVDGVDFQAGLYVVSNNDSSITSVIYDY